MSNTDEPKLDHVLLKRGLYYCPDSAGYTGRRDKAGLFPASLARPDCGVTAMAFKDAPLFAPGCWQDVKSEYYEEQLTVLQSRLDKAEAIIAPAAKLCLVEADYRWKHDTKGDGHIDTGRAWDKMRRASAALEASLKALTAKEGSL